MPSKNAQIFKIPNKNGVIFKENTAEGKMIVHCECCCYLSCVLNIQKILDIKVLNENSLRKFAIEFSEDGENFVRIGTYNLNSQYSGTVKTIYFKAVYAQVIRLVVLKGHPNIKF